VRGGQGAISISGQYRSTLKIPQFFMMVDNDKNLFVKTKILKTRRIK
jgi:hypothetical protein